MQKKKNAEKRDTEYWKNRGRGEILNWVLESPFYQ
jgi:hypothetical protein